MISERVLFVVHIPRRVKRGELLGGTGNVEDPDNDDLDDIVLDENYEGKYVVPKMITAQGEPVNEIVMDVLPDGKRRLSGKKKKSSRDPNEVVDILPDLKKRLIACEIPDALFTQDEDGERMQVTFTTSSLDKTDLAVVMLKDFGVGVLFGRMDLVPVHRSVAVSQLKKKMTEFDLLMQDEEDTEIQLGIVHEQVLNNITQAAEFTFDYFMLTVVAALLAGCALAVNNTVVIVASMLVSPLMGPILATTFAAVIGDFKLVKMGIRNELGALAICVLVGMLVGFFYAPFAADKMFEWPNSEMESRGTASSLLIGLTIAIPSGIGVALSVLGNNTSSLVGVAISASLLPPAVNAGICWAYAMVGHTKWAGLTKEQYKEFKDVDYVSIALTFKFKVKVQYPSKTQYWNFLNQEPASLKTVKHKGKESERLAARIRRRNQFMNTLTLANGNLGNAFSMRLPNVEERQDTLDRKNRREQTLKSGLATLFDQHSLVE